MYLGYKVLLLKIDGGLRNLEMLFGFKSAINSVSLENRNLQHPVGISEVDASGISKQSWIEEKSRKAMLKLGMKSKPCNRQEEQEHLVCHLQTRYLQELCA